MLFVPAEQRQQPLKTKGQKEKQEMPIACCLFVMGWELHADKSWFPLLCPFQQFPQRISYCKLLSTFFSNSILFFFFFYSKSYIQLQGIWQSKFHKRPRHSQKEEYSYLLSLILALKKLKNPSDTHLSIQFKSNCFFEVSKYGQK